MLTDLAALTPPLLVAVAFLIAAGAFLRHEMRRGKSPAGEQDAEDSSPDSAEADPTIPTDQGSQSNSPAAGHEES